MRIFSKIAIASTLFTIASAVAPSAADAQSPRWTGLYVGGSIGLQASETDYRTTSIFPTLVAPFTATPDSTARRSFDEVDWRFGAYTGYNFQLAPSWVVGLELGVGTTLDSSNPKTGIPGSPNSIAGFVLNTSQDRLSIATDWDASIKGRIGYLVTPATLAYMTGGIAFQDVVFRASCVGGAGANACLNNEFERKNSVRSGWTVGGGVEQALGGNLFARIDYAYADFGSFSHTFFKGAFNTATPFDDQFRGRIDTSTHQLNVGLAYKF